MSSTADAADVGDRDQPHDAISAGDLERLLDGDSARSVPFAADDAFERRANARDGPRLRRG